MNATSRPRNIAVGSQIDLIPSSSAELAASIAIPYSPPGPTARGGFPPRVGASGHWTWTASSRVSRCSWINVAPSSSASIAPVTVSILAMRPLYPGRGRSARDL